MTENFSMTNDKSVKLIGNQQGSTGIPPFHQRPANTVAADSHDHDDAVARCRKPPSTEAEAEEDSL